MDQDTQTSDPFVIDLEEAEEPTALEALSEVADLWGGEFSRGIRGGKLVLPVAAGIRRGLLNGHVSTERIAQGTRLRFPG